MRDVCAGRCRARDGLVNLYTHTHTHTLALSQTRREVRKYEARCTGGMWVRSHRHNICLLGHVFLHEREEVCDDICLTVNHT